MMDKVALENMLEQGKDSSLLRYTLGTLCLKEGLSEEAVCHLEEALRLDPEHTASWKFYARALTEAGRLEEARSAYSQGIAVARVKGDVQALKEMQVFLKRIA